MLHKIIIAASALVELANAKCFNITFDPFEDHSNVEVKLPIRSWASNQMVHHIAGIILEEFLGYNVSFQDVKDTSQSTDWAQQLVDGVIDMELELWNYIPKVYKEHQDDITMKAIIGYDSKSGIFLSPGTLAKNKLLDYYKLFESTSGLQSPNLRFLAKEESQTTLNNTCSHHDWCDTFTRWSPSKCNSQSCIELLHRVSKDDTGTIETLIQTFNLAVSVGYYGEAGHEDAVLSRISEGRDFLFYLWEPDPLVSRVNPDRVQFPHYFTGCDDKFTLNPKTGSKPCDFEGKQPKKAIANRMVQHSPRVAYFVQKYHLSNADIKTALGFLSADGQTLPVEKAACLFLKQDQRFEKTILSSDGAAPACVREHRPGLLKNIGDLTFDVTDLKCREVTGKCPKGQGFKNGCAYCPKGTWNDQSKSGMSECDPCPAGHTCGEATSVPTVCPKGHYCPEGSANVVRCKASTYNPAEKGESEQACLACPAGRFNPDPGQEQCRPCGLGQMSLGNSTACLSCPKGEFADTTGNVQCTKCKRAHQTTGGLAATGEDKCICKADYILSKDGLNCEPCPRHLVCLEGSSASAKVWDSDFPRIKRGYMTFKADHFFGYHCLDSNLCPGTEACSDEDVKKGGKCRALIAMDEGGASCHTSTRRGAACGRCQEWHVPVKGECVKCMEMNFGTSVLIGLLLALPLFIIALCTCTPCRGMCGGCGEGCGDCTAACGCLGCSKLLDKLKCSCSSPGAVACLAPCLKLLKVPKALAPKGQLAKFLKSVCKRSEELEHCALLLIPYVQTIAFVRLISVDQPGPVQATEDMASEVNPVGWSEEFQIPCFLAGGKDGLSGPRRLLVQFLAPVIIFGAVHLLMLLPPKLAYKFEEKTNIQITWGWVINICLSCFNAVYIMIVSLCFSVFMLYEHPRTPEPNSVVEMSVMSFPNVLFNNDPKNRLVEEGWIEGTGTWQWMLCMACLAMQVYVVSYGVVVALIAKYAPYFYTHPNPVWRRFFIKSTYWAVSKYRPDRWWWCTVVLTKSVFIGFASFFSFPEFQLTWLSIVVSVYLALQFAAWPWNWSSQNYMDSLASLTLLVYFTGSAFFVVPPENVDPSYVRERVGIVICIAMWCPFLVFCVAVARVMYRKNVGKIHHTGDKIRLGFEFAQVMGLVVKQPLHKIDKFMISYLTEADRTSIRDTMDIFLTEMFRFQPASESQGTVQKSWSKTFKDHRITKSSLKEEKHKWKDEQKNNIHFEYLKPADVVEAWRRKKRGEIPSITAKESTKEEMMAKDQHKVDKIRFMPLHKEEARRELARLLLYKHPDDVAGPETAIEDMMLLEKFRKRLAEYQERLDKHEKSSFKKSLTTDTETLYGKALRSSIVDCDGIVSKEFLATDEEGNTVAEDVFRFTFDQFCQLLAKVMPEHKPDYAQDWRLFKIFDVHDDEEVNNQDISIILETVHNGWIADIQRVKNTAIAFGNRWRINSKATLKKPYHSRTYGELVGDVMKKRPDGDKVEPFQAQKGSAPKELVFFGEPASKDLVKDGDFPSIPGAPAQDVMENALRSAADEQSRPVPPGIVLRSDIEADPEELGVSLRSESDLPAMEAGQAIPRGLSFTALEGKVQELEGKQSIAVSEEEQQNGTAMKVNPSGAALEAQMQVEERLADMQLDHTSGTSKEEQGNHTHDNSGAQDSQVSLNEESSSEADMCARTTENSSPRG